MSLFSRIGRIFSEQEKQKQKLDISDAIKIIEDQKNEKANTIIEDSYKDALQIYSEIQALRGLISAFKNIKIEEKKAKASNDVKDRFCAASEKQLSAIVKPQKELEDIKEFLNQVERTFASLGGLTPKQVMHIGFFFKRDVSEISRKTVIIGDLVLKAKKSMHMLDEYENFYRVRKEIESLEQKASLMEKETKSIENTSEMLEADMEKIKNEIESIDTTELNNVEKEFAESESTKSLIEQELLSYLSVEKILRKLRHQENIADGVLDAYIRSPSAALIEDNELRIFQFIEQAISLASKLELDAKNILKLKRILERKDYIKEKRKELIESLKNAEEKKRIMDTVRNSIEERKKLLEMTKKSIENHINNDNRDIEKIDSDITDIRKKIEDSKNELKMMAQRLTGSEIL